MPALVYTHRCTRYHYLGPAGVRSADPPWSLMDVKEAQESEGGTGESSVFCR